MKHLGIGRIVGLVIVAVCLGTTVAVAASIAVDPRTLGAASATTPRCVTTGLSVLPVLSVSNVASVTVGVLPSSCAGATLRVTVDNGSAAGSGSLVVPGGGGSVSVTITGGPVLTTSVRTDLVLEGP